MSQIDKGRERAEPLLKIVGLRASAGGQEILAGVDLEVAPGEIVAVMGPNGSGKSTLSHVLMGRPGYEVTGGSVIFGGEDLLAMPTYMRARLGLFLALQSPIEVPGVDLRTAMEAALGDRDRGQEGHLDEAIKAEMDRVGMDPALLRRALNVDLSGGERKRNETVQLGVLRPRLAVLDEIDSGLDVDGIRSVAGRLSAARDEWGLSVLAITHFNRLLVELVPDTVAVMASGRIVAHGGPELAGQLEESGYQGFA